MAWYDPVWDSDILDRVERARSKQEAPVTTLEEDVLDEIERRARAIRSDAGTDVSDLADAVRLLAAMMRERGTRGP